MIIHNRVAEFIDTSAKGIASAPLHSLSRPWKMFNPHTANGIM